MKISIEIRAAEGGDDAKALVPVQAAIYQTYARLHGVAVNTADSGLG